MKKTHLVAPVLLAVLLSPALSFAQSDPNATPTPSPSQEDEDTARNREHSRDGWYPAGKAKHNGQGHWSDGQQRPPDPWDLEDPNGDSIFLFPTGRTLRRNQLTLGFPGPAGIPDIQYGLSDWLQIGAGYSLIGFTPTARLGLIRGRRVDLSLIGGGYLPAGASHPFVGQFGGAMLSAGREEFRVHLGYQFIQLWGDPFPDVRSVEGGLGMTGVEVRILPQAKFLFTVLNFSQINVQDGTEPFYAVAVSPGIRIYGRNLSADIGAMVGQVYNLKMKRDEEPKNGTFALPMITLRYQM